MNKREEREELTEALKMANYILGNEPPTPQDIALLTWQMKSLQQLGAPSQTINDIQRLIRGAKSDDLNIAAAYYSYTKVTIEEAFRIIWKTRYETGRPW